MCRYLDPVATQNLEAAPVRMSTSQRMPHAESKTRRRSQEAFEEDLRAHLAARAPHRSAAPGISRVRSGLDLDMLDAIKEAVGLSWTTLEGVLGVSARTLQRRRRRGEGLTPTESDRLWRLLHVWHRSAEAFDDEDAARAWLKAPHGLLGGESPLERLDTEPGLREVEDMLTVIDETAAA